MKTARLKHFTFNILIFLVSLGFLFLIGEFVVRLIYKQETVLFPRYHTDVKYGEFTLRRIRPNSVFWHTSRDGSWEFITNEQGFRNRENFTYKKKENVIRVISMGDSHTQGYEVRQDYTYSAIIEKYLNQHGIKSEVINAGVSGFSTAEALLFLENEGVKYKPDYVILGFFANDYEDNIKAGFYKLDDADNLVIQKKEHVPGVKIQNLMYEIPLVKWMSENSYFYSLLFNTTWVYFKNKLAENAAEQVAEYAIPTNNKLSNYQQQLTDKLLERMYRFCKENNIKLIVIDIPKIESEKIVASSLTLPTLNIVMQNSDAYLTTEMVLGDYNGVAEIHRPHGHRHISEFTHTLYGVAVAKEIQVMRNNYQ